MEFLNHYNDGQLFFLFYAALLSIPGAIYVLYLLFKGELEDKDDERK